MSIWLPVVPTGNRTVETPIMPLRTRVNRSFISGVGSPTMTVRVMSVVPSWYWPPELMRKISFMPSLRSEPSVDPVVGQGGVRAGAGDRLEGQVLERARGMAEFFELLGDGDLRELSLRRRGLEPA